MSRYLVAVCITLFCLFQAKLMFGQQNNKRPNIVLYVADDLGAIDIGPYGNKSVRTPNLEKLSSESMLFNSAFSTTATCVPARSALFTAQYPHRNGSHVNRMPVDSNVNSIVQYFAKEGYRVAIAGKLHVGPKEVFNFEYIEGTNRREPGTEGKQGMFTDLYLDPVDKWLANYKSSQPFVLILADHSTHMTWPLNPAYTSESVKIHPFHVGVDGTRKLLARYYTDITKMDDNIGDVMTALNKYNLFDNTIMMFTADQGPQLPFGKWTLYDYGVQVPLIVRWPNHIAPGSKTDALVSHVDIIPTLLEMIGAKNPTGIDGKSFFQVLKDVKAITRENVFATYNGDKAHDQSPSRMLRTSKYKYIVNLEPDMPVSKGKVPPPAWVKLAKTDTHAKSIVTRMEQRSKEELYDIENDRFEMNNLAHLPKYKTILENFRKQMELIRTEQGDIGDNWKEDLKKLPEGILPNPAVPYGF